MKKLFRITTILVLLQSAMYLAGCGIFEKQDPFAKQQLQAQEFYLQNPGELAKVCAQKFPVIGRLDTGKWVIMADTNIRLSGMPLPTVASGGIFVGRKSDSIKAGPKFIIRTITLSKLRVDTLRVKDRAEADSLQNYLVKARTAADKATQQAADSQKTAGSRLWIIIGESLVIIILLIIVIRKFL